MKKLLYSLFFLFSLTWVFSSQAGIIGATYWINDEGKKVILYFDNHESGAPDEVAAMFAFIEHTVLKQAATRTKPLLILVENYMREAQYRELVQRVHRIGGHNTRFLQQFDPWVDRDLAGPITVKSIEARTIPFLTFPLLCEWQKRHNGRTILPDDLYSELDETFAGLTFKHVFDQANEIQGYINHAPTKKLSAIFTKH